MRIQLLLQLVLQVSQTSVEISRRTKGGLTGTRVAGALGRVPILDMIAERERYWRDYGFKLTPGPEETSLTVATYIDNLLSVSNNVDGAIWIMRDAECYLLSKWQLSLKPSSKIVTSAAVGAEFVAGGLVDAYIYQGFSCFGSYVT